MAQQTPFDANRPDDDRRREPRPEAVSPGRYSESRSANFVGGSVDPESGNVTRSSPLEVERGAMPTTPKPTESPQQPETRLGRVEAPPAPTPQPVPPMPVYQPPPPPRSNTLGTIATIALVGLTLFCYLRGTRIAMADGSWKRVEDIKIGDIVELGGMVTARGEALADEIFAYRDQMVTGSHAVFEDGKFVRVADSPIAKKMAPISASGLDLVYPLVTEKHLLLLEDHIAADFNETDEGGEVSAAQRLETMNADTKRNAWLSYIARERGFDQDRKLRSRAPLPLA